ncbi:MAG TPA: hypothetical protein VNK04_03610 [Gemmataceae bacterium]|nr:hypothetical protein [Gemmataceae bacterium]
MAAPLLEEAKVHKRDNRRRGEARCPEERRACQEVDRPALP